MTGQWLLWGDQITQGPHTQRLIHFTHTGARYTGYHWYAGDLEITMTTWIDVWGPGIARNYLQLGWGPQCWENPGHLDPICTTGWSSTLGIDPYNRMQQTKLQLFWPVQTLVGGCVSVVGRGMVVAAGSMQQLLARPASRIQHGVRSSKLPAGLHHQSQHTPRWKDAHLPGKYCGIERSQVHPVGCQWRLASERFAGRRVQPVGMFRMGS